MTEDEAKTKWCPMVNVASNGASFFDNRNGYSGNQKNVCIGSECMMWRTAAKTPDGGLVGFCGLAGKL